MNFTRLDRGAAAIIVAISMLVIMGFAALVIDLGAGFNERAQDQSAADASVITPSVRTIAKGNPPSRSPNSSLQLGHHDRQN